MHHVRARQREEYGGINWGAAFFGWLVAVGVAVLLTGLLAAAGAAIGLTETTSDAADSASPETLSAAGAIALLVVLADRLLLRRLRRRAHVALRRRPPGDRHLVRRPADHARPSRSSPWWRARSTTSSSARNLPRLPIGAETLTTGGAIASLAIVLGTLLFAALGGIAGSRYHHKVDRAGYPE